MLYILHDNFVILFTIANGNDLNVMEFKQSELRRHLADLFPQKPTPTISTYYRSCSLCEAILPCNQMGIYCDCDLLEVYHNTIQCDVCNQWHHLRCVGVESPNLSQKWFCSA